MISKFQLDLFTETLTLKWYLHGGSCAKSFRLQLVDCERCLRWLWLTLILSSNPLNPLLIIPCTQQPPQQSQPEFIVSSFSYRDKVISATSMDLCSFKAGLLLFTQLILEASTLLFGTQIHLCHCSILPACSHGSPQEPPVSNSVGVTLLPQHRHSIVLLTLNQSQSKPGWGRYCLPWGSLYITKLSFSISRNIILKNKIK